MNPLPTLPETLSYLERSCHLLDEAREDNAPIYYQHQLLIAQWVTCFMAALLFAGVKDPDVHN